jgi:hypothetical protein
MPGYGVVVFSVAARPACSEDAVAQWVSYICDQRGITLDKMSDALIGGMPAIVAEALQGSEVDFMRIRTSFLEDGQRFFNISCMAPQQIWTSVEPVLLRMMQSFWLAETRGPTAALHPQGAAE